MKRPNDVVIFGVSLVKVLDVQKVTAMAPLGSGDR